jgi:hypothetical protein
MRAEHRTGMPSTRQHLATVQGQADARTHLEAGDRRRQHPIATDAAKSFRRGE